MKIVRLGPSDSYYTKGKLYEVIKDDGRRWQFMDDNGYRQIIHKSSSNWRAGYDDTKVTDVPKGYAFRIGCTEGMTSYTKGKYYPILPKNTRGKVWVKADNGQEYSVSLTGAVWEYRETKDTDVPKVTVYIRKFHTTCDSPHFTLHKPYEVVSESSPHWTVLDNQGDAVKINKKATEFWELVPEEPKETDVPEETKVTEEPGFTRRISTVTRRAPGSGMFTQGDTYRVLDQQGTTVHIKDDQGDPYYFDTGYATYWEAEYETNVNNDNNVNNETNETNEPEQSMKIKIENNVTMINGVRADGMTVEQFLSLISNKQEELRDLEDTGLGETSKVIGDRIHQAEKDITELVDAMDTQHTEDTGDTKDTKDN